MHSQVAMRLRQIQILLVTDVQFQKGNLAAIKLMVFIEYRGIGFAKETQMAYCVSMWRRINYRHSTLTCLYQSDFSFFVSISSLRQLQSFIRILVCIGQAFKSTHKYCILSSYS